MVFGSGLDLFEQMGADLLDGCDELVARYKAKGPDKARKIPTNHLLVCYSTFAKFQKIAGLSHWGDTDIRIIIRAAAHWADDYQFRKRQAWEIKFSVLFF